jgi:hypothetical protein
VGKGQRARGCVERSKEVIHNFSKSSWLFFGIISSICGASFGYVSMTLVRMARCTEDFTLDFAPGVRLVEKIAV